MFVGLSEKKVARVFHEFGLTLTPTAFERLSFLLKDPRPTMLPVFLKIYASLPAFLRRRLLTTSPVLSLKGLCATTVLADFKPETMPDSSNLKEWRQVV